MVHKVTFSYTISLLCTDGTILPDVKVADRQTLSMVLKAWVAVWGWEMALVKKGNVVMFNGAGGDADAFDGLVENLSHA